MELCAVINCSREGSFFDLLADKSTGHEWAAWLCATHHVDAQSDAGRALSFRWITFAPWSQMEAK